MIRTILCSSFSLWIKVLIRLTNHQSAHGDYDHMGEAINLVENFKVEKVIFNCGEFNDLEQDLIKVLEKRKIPYYSCIKELNVDNNKLYFLNNKDYGNENDNSSVIYIELNNHKFIFIGDAGVEAEQDLIEISKACYPYEAYKKYFSFDLDEERKSLKLVRKKIYIP